MASAMRKMAVYLGLVEDADRYDDRYDGEYGPEEYDEYSEHGDLPEPAVPTSAQAPPQAAPRSARGRAGAAGGSPQRRGRGATRS